MFGPPKPKEGKCNAELHIADDYGDNHATLQCQLDPGHAGPHREEFKRDEKPVVVTWECDEREWTQVRCPNCPVYQDCLNARGGADTYVDGQATCSRCGTEFLLFVTVEDAELELKELPWPCDEDGAETSDAFCRAPVAYEAEEPPWFCKNCRGK